MLFQYHKLRNTGLDVRTVVHVYILYSPILKIPNSRRVRLMIIDYDKRILGTLPLLLDFLLKLISLCSDDLTMNPMSFTSSYLRKLTVPTTCALDNMIDN